MTNHELFDKILQHPDLIAQPPVLLDIGASGNLNSNWQSIAKHSICIAFDADDRDMDFINDKAKNFKQLHIIRKIVSDQEIDSADFYLTSSPYCSSLLRPDNESLSEWAFADLFKIEKKIRLQSISLQKALFDLKIDNIDWFKSDAQGLDVRLFKNLTYRQQNTIVADFEPGFIDAYIGEDKLKHLLEYMDNMPFWLCGFVVGGNPRMNIPNLKPFLKESEIDNIKYRTQDSPICANVTYFNDFKQPQLNTERNHLLGCLFSIILKQYGYAAELAIKGSSAYDNSLFNLILDHIKLTTRKPTFKMLITQPPLLKRKVINALLYKLHQLL